MAKKLKKSFFIVLDGPEGSGKSSIARRLAADLGEMGFKVLLTSEPGGMRLGSMIREILLHKKEISLAAEAELLLFEADRAQHVKEVILPALADGKAVICDRFSAATMAYQGYGRGMDKKLIQMVDAFATGGLVPDLTVILDVDPETGLSRVRKVRATDKMERLGMQFHKKVRKGFLEVARKSRGRVKVVDSSGALEKAYCGTRELVYDLIKGHKRTE